MQWALWGFQESRGDKIELTTPRTPYECATRLRYTPTIIFLLTIPEAKSKPLMLRDFFAPALVEGSAASVVWFGAE